MCKVSIIMPVYNKEKYVARAIESILNQTMKDWELLIIDDGSTDSSYEVCNRFQDERIKLVHVQNGGVSKARNIGLEMARGEYVAFVDGDDEVSHQYLEKLLIYECDMAISGLIRKNQEKHFLSQLQTPYVGKKKMEEILHEFYQCQIQNGIYGFVAGKIVRRNIIEEHNIRFDEKLRLAEDFDFFLKVYHYINEIIFVNEGHYYYYDDNADNFNINYKEIPSQIGIQIKIRDFLLSQQRFSFNDEKVMGKRIGGLIYTYLITCEYESYNEFVQCVNLIYQLRIELKYLSESIRGNFVLQLFKFRRSKDIYIILCWRNWFRRRFRRV